METKNNYIHNIVRNGLVFLDIDGVMNRTSDGTSYFAGEPSLYGISKVCARNLHQIVDSTGAKIVVTSNWRNHEPNAEFVFKGKRFRNPMTKLVKEFQKDIVTMLRPTNGIPKATLVAEFLSADVHKDVPFVIFDDNPREEYQKDHILKEHFVKTDIRRGISEIEVFLAWKILHIGR